jgi:hypothetical protein
VEGLGGGKPKAVLASPRADADNPVMGVVVLYNTNVLWDMLADTFDKIEAAGERGGPVDPADIDALVRLNLRIIEMTERREEARRRGGRRRENRR